MFLKYLNESINNKIENLKSEKIPEEKLIRPNQSNKKYFPYADNSKYGKRNKLGGKPDWIHHDETPKCKHCNKNMTFYGQLDSINDKYMIGDSGMIYVFYCFDCGEIKAITQSY